MMPSFDLVNYSLRPNKSIQRSLVFEGVRLLSGGVDFSQIIYVGFGSIWFTDFQIAHKGLRIAEMISIEADEIGFARAKFNRPFRTVRMESGWSNQVIPELLKEPKLISKPWMIWLDYDGSLNEDVVEDFQNLVECAPPNSILVATFNALGYKYGKPKDRPGRLQDLLGEVVPDDLLREECDEENLPATLAKYALGYMKSAAEMTARPGGFVPAFNITYRDGANMVTVGGFLPQKGAASAAKSIIGSDLWPCVPGRPILTPPLTIKEVTVLQAQLPRKRPLTRKGVQRLGFDLQEEQLQSFQEYYRYYPNYAQITT